MTKGISLKKLVRIDIYLERYSEPLDSNMLETKTPTMGNWENF